MKKVLYPLIVSIGFIAILLLYFCGVGYQNGTLDLGQAFQLMAYAAWAGVAGAALALVYLLLRRPRGLKLGVLLLSLVAGLAAFYMPFRQQQLAAQAPAIHDITTDTRNPPQFVAVAPLRADAPNPITYEGEAVASKQLEAYPAIRTQVYRNSRDEVFDAAVQLIEDQGWELVAAEREEGRIEATVTTRWFGFKDDVVLRLNEGENGSTFFDMRSKSRVGRSDIGVNARRIRAFMDALSERLK